MDDWGKRFAKADKEYAQHKRKIELEKQWTETWHEANEPGAEFITHWMLNPGTVEKQADDYYFEARQSWSFRGGVDQRGVVCPGISGELRRSVNAFRTFKEVHPLWKHDMSEFAVMCAAQMRYGEPITFEVSKGF